MLEARNGDFRDLVRDDPLRSIRVDGFAHRDGESRGESFLVIRIFKCVDEAVPVGTIYDVPRSTVDAHTSTSLKIEFPLHAQSVSDACQPPIWLTMSLLYYIFLLLSILFYHFVIVV